MKLRLSEDYVRLRFRRSEVSALAETGKVAVKLGFPGGSTLSYRAIAAHVSSLCVKFDGGVVEILVPEGFSRAWPASDEVGLYGEQDGVQIVIEKDFRRSSAASPDDEDRYPNPRALAREAVEAK